MSPRLHLPASLSRRGGSSIRKPRWESENKAIDGRVETRQFERLKKYGSFPLPLGVSTPPVSFFLFHKAVPPSASLQSVNVGAQRSEGPL